MNELRFMVPLLLAITVAGCEDESCCWHNCPEEPDEVCSAAPWNDRSAAECRERAEEMCEMYEPGKEPRSTVREDDGNRAYECANPPSWCGGARP